MDMCLSSPDSEAANPEAVSQTPPLPPLMQAFDPALGPIFSNDNEQDNADDEACYLTMCQADFY